MTENLDAAKPSRTLNQLLQVETGQVRRGCVFKRNIGSGAGERESPPSIHEHPRTKGFKDFLWAGWLAAARAESGRRRALVLEDGCGSV